MIELDEIQLDEVVGTELESNLIIWNDDYNTFEWVILCLITLLGHEPTQAEQCAMIIHNTGKCSVKRGSYEELSGYKDALVLRGLNVTIE
jgi:ATP-dependent Clp protease adaptor protein ClpS